MSSPAAAATIRRAKPRTRLVVLSVAAVLLLVAMVLDTTIVRIGSGAETPHGAFSAADYGKATFPKVQAAIVERAVEAKTLAAAIDKDRAAAAKEHGIEVGAGPEMPVKFTGVVSKGDSGVYDVAVDGMPDTVAIRVQTGPAINGTDLRDATGTISFGQFTNQIDYQNAGSALNKEMKKQVLAKIDAGNLTGKTVAVVGAFHLLNPKIWLVTPVKLDVQP